MKKIQENSSTRLQKKFVFSIILKIILIILTVVFPILMVMLAGAGLIYNKESYGEELTRTGIMLIVSGFLMTAGTLLCCIRKNISALICSLSGCGLCMLMLYKLIDHADRSGWTDNLTLEPVSNMYASRILPVIVPVLLTIIIAIVQYFSLAEKEKRRLRRIAKEEKENAPSPPII